MVDKIPVSMISGLEAIVTPTATAHEMTDDYIYFGISDGTINRYTRPATTKMTGTGAWADRASLVYS